MSLVNVINKVLKSDKNYNISKLGDNGVEFSAPSLYMGSFVLYDCKKNFIFLQGSRTESKEDVTGLSWEEIAEKIIFKLDWRKRLGAITYQPEDKKKEVQDGLGNYFDNSKRDTEDYFKEPNISSIDLYFIDFSKTPFETIKQITPDIQHIITPSKNYFLFKLSNDGFKG